MRLADLKFLAGRYHPAVLMPVRFPVFSRDISRNLDRFGNRFVSIEPNNDQESKSQDLITFRCVAVAVLILRDFTW